MLDFLVGLLEISLGCALIIGLLLVLTPVLSKRFSPRWRYWAWLFVALRLAVPVRISLPQTPMRVEVPAALSVATYDASADYSWANDQGVSGAGMEAYTIHYAIDYTDTTGEEVVIRSELFYRQVTRGDDSTVTLYWDNIFFALWFLGAVGTLGWTLAGYRRFRRKAIRCSRSSLMQAGSVKVRWCEGIFSPMLMGFFRPVILLPEGMPEHVIEPTLAHELTHFKRHDLWYKLLLIIARSVHWFNPLVWWMVRRAGQDVELCCDYDLLKGQDAQARRTYGQAILDQMTAGDRGTSSLTTGFFGNKKSVFVRFRAIMDTAPRKKGYAALIFAACMITLTGGLVSCIPSEASDMQLDTQLALVTQGEEEEEGLDLLENPRTEEEQDFTEVDLDFTNECAKYNGYEHDLQVSAVEHKGELCYQFENAEQGIRLLTWLADESDGWQAQAFYGSWSMTFDMPVFPLAHWKYGHVAGEAELYLADLTGDGISELIYIYGYHNFGFGDDTCRVFDLTTMEEYPVQVDFSNMEASTQAEIVEWRDDQMIFQITGPDGRSGLAAIYCPENMIQKVEPGVSMGHCFYIELNEERSGLVLKTLLGANPSPWLNGLGTLSACLTYVPSLKAFTVSPPFVMELYAPKK